MNQRYVKVNYQNGNRSLYLKHVTLLDPILISKNKKYGYINRT